jgi:hypothetical protein
MKHQIYPSGSRGLKDLGWLKSNFTFSFSNYYDPTKNGFGLLKTFNDDYVKAENGFGLHGHMNMEIISIMLAGSMNHIDSLGYKEVVKKDWVQIMSAGSGLRHEEHNVGEDEVNFLQIWIEPKLQNITPRYQRRYLPEENRLNKLVTIVSNEEGQSHCWINQNAKLSLGFFDQDKDIAYSMNPINKALYIFNINGKINTQGIELNERDGLGLWDIDNIMLKTSMQSRFLIIEVPINH